MLATAAAALAADEGPRLLLRGQSASLHEFAVAHPSAIEARAVSVHDHWVATEGLTFRGRDDADRLGDMVKLHWEAVAADGTVSAVGLSLLVLAGDGRIDRDYTFIVA